MVFRVKYQEILRSRKTRSLLAFSGCLLLGVTGCERFGDRTRDVIVGVQKLGDGQTRLTNKNTDVELTLPDGWIDVQDLRPDADLYASDEDRTMYVLVLSDPKRSEVGAFSLANNSEQYLKFLDRGLNPGQPGVPTTMTTINGLDALQYEVRGQVDNLPIVYLHTTVEGKTDYYQVVAWTSAEKYGAAKGELQTVIQSFQGS